MDGVGQPRTSEPAPSDPRLQPAVIVIGDLDYGRRLESKLRSKSFTLRIACTEVDALEELANGQRFDAAISDVRLGGVLIGPPLFQELARRRIGTVILSELGPAVAGRIAADHGAATYLREPTTTKRIARAVRIAADRSEELRAMEHSEPQTAAHTHPRSVPVDGDAVRAARRALALTQEQLVENIALSRGTISKAENSGAISLLSLAVLAEALGKTPEDFALLG